jgi:hypothetical protein
VLLDLGPAGLQGEPVWLLIPATPMHDVTVTDAVAELRARNSSRYQHQGCRSAGSDLTPCKRRLFRLGIRRRLSHPAH